VHRLEELIQLSTTDTEPTPTSI